MGRTVALIGACILVSSLRAQSPGTLRQFNRQIGEAALRARPDFRSLRQSLRQRAAEWKRLASEDPKLAVESVLPESVRIRLRNDPESAQFIETAGEWSGTFERWIADDFDSGRHRALYGLRSGAGLLSLYFAEEPPDAACSAGLRIEGFRMDNILAVTRTSEERAAGGTCTATGEQKVAVLLVNLADASLPSNITAPLVRNLYFGSGNTLDAFWREASYGRAFGSGEVIGPLNLGITYQCNDADVLGSSFPILQAAIAAADGQIDFRQYTHVAVIVPNEKFCSAGGFATLGCSDLASPGDGTFRASRTFIRAGAVNLAAITHEAGHTLGLNHSGALYYAGQPLGPPGVTPPIEEYGNPFDTMGGATCGSGAATGHYSAQHKSNLGWLVPSNIQPVDFNGSFAINQTETASSGTQVLRVRRGVGNDQWLWLEYRRPVGFDATLQSCQATPYNGVLVYLENPAAPADTRTRLLDFGNSLNLANNGQRKAFAAALNAGQSWTDPYTQLRLEVLSAGATAATVRVTYDAPCASLSPAGATHSAAAQGGSITVSASGTCSGTAISNTPWITVTGGANFAGNSAVTYSLSANATAQPRTGNLSIGRQTFTITQNSANGQPSPVSSSPSSGVSTAGSARRFRFVFTDPDGAGQLADVGAVIGTSSSILNACHFSFRSSDRLLRMFSDDGGGWLGYPIGTNQLLDSNSQCQINASTTTATVTGSTLELIVDVVFLPGFTGAKNIYLFAKDTPGADSGRILMGSWTVNPGTAAGSGLGFVPLIPCRVMDTRAGGGLSGAFGPPMLSGGITRTLPVPAGACGIPLTAKAYAVNVTVAPQGPLAFLTLWPSGTPRPPVSALNSFEGRVVANSAIVPAGTSGAIDLYATSATDVIVDVNGYFTDQTTAASLAFYPVTPCRVIDTRAGQGTSGAFGPPSFAANTTRGFVIAQGRCNIPPGAQAYSLNITVAPQAALGFLAAWPSGQSRPQVSTLNSFEGRVVANGAIVPAGSGGGINIFTTNATDVIVDINGYFAPDDGAGLYFRTVTPCRAGDTRTGQGFSGAFGPPSLTGGTTRNFPLAAVCGVASSARAYSMNLTVAPSAGVLQYLTAWPGGGAQPFVSTLNSFDGRVVANAALVPAGGDGSVNVFVTDATDVLVDLNGYFSR